MKKRIIISGASGFIGKAVIPLLLEKDYEIIALTRNPSSSRSFFPEDVSAVGWDAYTGAGWSDQLEGAEAVINLAGENIGSGIWTGKKKRKIRESRINATRAIAGAIQEVQRKPRLVIQASAIGYYGSQGDQILTESDEPGQGFVAEVTSEWEQSAAPINDAGVSLVILRTGLVLGQGGGILSRIVLPFRGFVGGHFGGGDQWISWIHISDLLQVILFFLERTDLKGIYNLTSPQPVIAREFFREIGRALHRPSWIHLPAFLLNLVLGDMARETLLSSQRVIPAKLSDLDFPFRFPRLPEALADIL